MGWIWIDDHYDEHPKLSKAGPLGIALWLAGLAYCHRNLTDGFIPYNKVKLLVNWEFFDEKGIIWRVGMFSDGELMGQGEDVDSNAVTNTLVTCGLWEEVTDGNLILGYNVHDYLDYQPSKEEILSHREKAAKRASDWKQRRLLNKSNGKSNGVSNTTIPIPIPIPIPFLKEEVHICDNLEFTPEKLINLYNERKPKTCPKLRTITTGRLKKCCEYLKMFPEKEWWEKVFSEMHKSKFLSNLTPPQPGHEQFKTNLDWLLQRGKDGVENCVKVYEGEKYRDSTFQDRTKQVIREKETAFYGELK